MKTNIPENGQALAELGGAVGEKLPATLKDCEHLLELCRLADNIPGSIRCIAIARARAFFDREETAAWLDWCRDKWTAAKSSAEIQHKKQIGNLLMACRRKMWYTTLLTFNQDWQLALAGKNVQAGTLDAFMATTDFSKIKTREQFKLRLHLVVHGKALPKTKGAGKNLPAKGAQLDFLNALFADREDTTAELQIKIKTAAEKASPGQAWTGAARAMIAVDALAPRLDQAQKLMLATSLEEEAGMLRRMATGVDKKD